MSMFFYHHHINRATDIRLHRVGSQLEIPNLVGEYGAYFVYPKTTVTRTLGLSVPNYGSLRYILEPLGGGSSSKEGHSRVAVARYPSYFHESNWVNEQRNCSHKSHFTQVSHVSHVIWHIPSNFCFHV